MTERTFRAYLKVWVSKLYKRILLLSLNPNSGVEESGVLSGLITRGSMVQIHPPLSHSFRQISGAKHFNPSAPKARGKWVAIKDLDAVRIIESDKWMMRTLLNKKLDVNHVVMHERPEGMSFSVLPLHS